MARDPESSVPPPQREGELGTTEVNPEQRGREQRGQEQRGQEQSGQEQSGVVRVRRHRYKTAPATPQSIIEELRRASQKKPPR